MTAADRLNEIEARHIAWHDSLPNIAKWSDLHGALSSTAGATADELAMAWELARNDVPALVAALRAVLDLHRPVPVYAYAEDCGCGNEDHFIIEDEWGEDLCFDTPTGDVQCSHCRAEQSYVEHPCETVRAIEEALND